MTHPGTRAHQLTVAALRLGSARQDRALRELDRHTPVMLVVEVGAVFTTVAPSLDPALFAVSITLWLWLTVLFGTLAESVAEGRGKAQAASLRDPSRRPRPDASPAPRPGRAPAG